MNNIPIFIVHYTPLVKRKKHMINELSKYNFDFTFEEKYNKEDLTKEDLKRFIGIKKSEISLTCKHLNIYKKMVENDIDVGIIFEDDVTLYDNFENKLSDYYNQLPDDWGMFFFGSGWNLHVPEKLVKKSNKNVFLKSNQGMGLWSPECKYGGWPICGGSTRCMDSYIIKKETAQKIINYCNKGRIFRPFDLFLNQCFRDLNIKSYWGEPSLCRQDTFSSSIKGDD
ncbi:glycosyltransferase family 25 protein [bacterium]|nr:glycosyltransferase family 25 protein [bacterium]